MTWKEARLWALFVEALFWLIAWELWGLLCMLVLGTDVEFIMVMRTLCIGTTYLHKIVKV